MKNSILILTLLVCFSCSEIKTDTNYTPPTQQESDVFLRGKRQLEVQGYKNIKEISYPYFCCDKNDSWVSTGFQADDKDGIRTTGCICAKYMFGGSITIRFE